LDWIYRSIQYFILIFGKIRKIFFVMFQLYINYLLCIAQKLWNSTNLFRLLILKSLKYFSTYCYIIFILYCLLYNYIQNFIQYTSQYCTFTSKYIRFFFINFFIHFYFICYETIIKSVFKWLWLFFLSNNFPLYNNLTLSCKINEKHRLISY